MNTPLDDADLFLMGGSGGPPSLFNKYDRPGTRKGGKVLKREKTQQRKFGTGELLFFDEEKTKPREQLEITVQTDLRDPENDEDTGRRRVFVRGNTDLFEKLQNAIRTVNAPGVQVGGELWVTRQQQMQRNGKNGTYDEWIHHVEYVPAKPEEDSFLMGEGPATTPAPSMPPQLPEATTPSSAPVPAPTVAPASAPIPASPQNGDGASSLDWSKLGHLSMETRIQLASIPGLTTEAVLAMHPAPAPAASSGNENGGLDRAEFPGVDERQWAAIKEAVEVKGVPVSALKAMYGGVSATP